MNGIEFSLIVPVYNVEQYLRRCLDSIAAQSYRQYEVICVNDGSTDNSLAVLAEYKDVIPNYHVISQENRGLGGARNTGIEKAKGEYIWFIDSDDWIAPDALQRMADIAESEHPGVIMVDLTRIYEDGGRKVRSVTGGFAPNEPLTCETFTKHLLLYDGIYAAQSKIFRSDILGNFRFSKGFYEDIPLVTLFGTADYPIHHLQGDTYFYFQRSGSIMRTIDSRILDIFSQFDIVYERLAYKPEYRVLLSHFFHYLATLTYEKSKQSGQRPLILATKERYKIGKDKVMPFWSMIKTVDVPLRRKLKLAYYHILMT